MPGGACGLVDPAVDAITVIEAAIARYGAPEYLRSDNGSEFIAYVIQDWLKERQIRTLYIRPGSPWENGHIESFHDKLRDECLNRELFGTLAEAPIILESWRIEYNEKRPHSSLATRRRRSLRGAANLGSSRPTASFRPNLPTSTARDLMESNNRQNYTFNLSSFWSQATTLKKH